MVKAGALELESGKKRLNECSLAADELEASRQLSALEATEAALLEDVEKQRALESVEELAVEQMQGQIVDLSGECGMILLECAGESDRDGADDDRALAMLRGVLPASYFGKEISLEELLMLLERQRTEICDLLRAADTSAAVDSEIGLTGDPLQRSGREVEWMRQEVQSLQAETQSQFRASSEMESEVEDVKRAAHEDLDDCEIELSEVRRETELLRRQQTECQQAQVRMLRLIDELQRERVKGVHAQAVVATRLGELQRDTRVGELTRVRVGTASSVGTTSPPNSPPRGVGNSNANANRQLWPDAPHRQTPGRAN